MTDAIGPLVRGQLGRAFPYLFDLGSKICTADERGRRFTYAEYKDRALRLTNGLIDLGLRQGTDTAILGRNSPEYLECMYIPPMLLNSRLGEINFNLTAGEVAQHIDRLEAKVAFVDDEYVNVMSEVRSRSKTLEDIIVIGESAPADTILYEDLIRSSSSKVPDSNVAPGTFGGPMWHTGGTTGLPKGVEMAAHMGDMLLPEHINEKLFGMLESLLLTNNLLASSQVSLHLTPLYHAAGYMMSFAPILAGGTNVTMRKFDAEEALRLIEEEKVTCTFTPPIVVRRLLSVPNKEKYDIKSLKMMWISAAPCPFELKKEAVDFFGPIVYESYSSSDLPLDTWLTPKHYINNPDRLKSVGKIASPGYKIKFLDENGEECPPGVDGVLHISSFYGDFITYYKDPKRTKERIKIIDGERYVNDGEIGHVDDDGFYYITGREKEMIISGGENIYPDEIENVISTHPKVMDATVIGIPDPEWGESVKAVVELKKGESATEEEIIEHCKKYLSGFKKPKSVDFWDELPRHTDGHVNKRFIREKYQKT